MAAEYTWKNLFFLHVYNILTFCYGKNDKEKIINKNLGNVTVLTLTLD